MIAETRAISAADSGSRGCATPPKPSCLDRVCTGWSIGFLLLARVALLRLPGGAYHVVGATTKPESNRGPSYRSVRIASRNCVPAAPATDRRRAPPTERIELPGKTADRSALSPVSQVNSMASEYLDTCHAGSLNAEQAG